MSSELRMDFCLHRQWRLFRISPGETFIILQWIYALWQILRETPPVLAAFYCVQTFVRNELRYVKRKNENLVDPKGTGHRYMQLDNPMDPEKKPEVLYLSSQNKLNRTYEPTYVKFKEEYFDDKKQKEAGIDGVKLIDFKDFWYKVEFEVSFYYCHQNVLFEWVMYDIENTILLINAQNFTNDLVLGERVKPKDFFEGLLAMDMHINELYAPCLFGSEMSVKVSLRLSAMLATVPLLLQARGLAVESAATTLAIIFVDIFGVPLYNIYDLVMFYASKFAKLYIFRRCRSMYTFFGWFSKRWATCDRDKGYANYTDGNEMYPITTFVQFAKAGDVEMQGIAYRGKPCIESYGFQIDGTYIHAAGFGYGEHCLYVRPKARMFVS